VDGEVYRKEVRGCMKWTVCLDFMHCCVLLCSTSVAYVTDNFLSCRCNTNSYIEMDVTLHREANEELGFSVVGGIGSPKGDCPIFVKYISTKGLAGQSGRLKCGDEILKINRIAIDNMTQSQVVKLIKSFSGSVTLTIRSELAQR